MDLAYLDRASRSGTTLAFLVLLVSTSNIMDAAATGRGARCAVLDQSPPVQTLLVKDARRNPTTKYRFETSLSIDLMTAIKQITDLAADVKEGNVISKADIEQKSNQIQERLLVRTSILCLSQFRRQDADVKLF